MSATEVPQLLLPDDFDEYAWEVEAKGYFGEAVVAVGSRRHKITFYDPVRLAQDVESSLVDRFMVLPTNTVVIESVNREQMEQFVVQHFGGV